MTNTTITLTAPACVRKYNELLKANASAVELAKAETALNDAVKADNKAAKENRVHELLNIRTAKGESAFFDAYLNDRTYPGNAAVKDKDDNSYELKDRTMMLTFSDLEKVFKAESENSADSLARDGRYKAFVELLQWNFARATSKDLEATGKQILTDKKLEAMAKDPSLKVFLGCTNGALLAQIQMIADCILPENYAAVKLNSADCKYVKLASVQRVRRGTVTGSKDTAVLEEVITAIHYRKNGLHYEFQSKSAGMKMRKSDLTPKQEEVLAAAKDPAPTAVQAADNARKEMAKAAKAAKAEAAA